MIKVTMMMAVTADGKIAKNDHHLPTDWTSKEDKELFKEISKEHGAVMMGEKTYDTLPGPLPDRLNVIFTLKKDLPAVPGVKWVTGDPAKVLKELEALGYKKALLGGGTFLNSLFLEKKLIDEIILTVEPLIFGDGLSLFSKDLDIKLELKELKQINDDSYMVRYAVIY
jgi:dihydrofolate reductase